MDAVRFTDAKDLETLASMMDRWVRRNQATLYNRDYMAPFALLARAPERMQVGTLVQANGDGAVKRASASGNTPATGVVTGIEENNRVIWSPVAVVAMAVLGDTSAGLDELWLADNGKVSTERTAVEGYLDQKAGVRLYYDAFNQKHTCLIIPGPVMGISLLG